MIITLLTADEHDATQFTCFDANGAPVAVIAGVSSYVTADDVRGMSAEDLTERILRPAAHGLKHRLASAIID